MLTHKCFFGSILCYSQKWQWSTRRFNSQICLQATYQSRTSFCILGYLLEPCIEFWWFFLTLGQIVMAIENLKMAYDFSIFNFDLKFWLYVTSIKKADPHIHNHPHALHQHFFYSKFLAKFWPGKYDFNLYKIFEEFFSKSPDFYNKFQ
jgi:hypothetical protein